MMRTSTLIALLVASEAGVNAQHMLDLFAHEPADAHQNKDDTATQSFFIHELEPLHMEQKPVNLNLPKAMFDAKAVKEAIRSSSEFKLDSSYLVDTSTKWSAATTIPKHAPIGVEIPGALPQEPSTEPLKDTTQHP